MERQELIDALQNVNQAEVGVFVYFVMKNGAIEISSVSNSISKEYAEALKR